MGEKEWMNDWMNSIIESNSTRTGNEPEKKYSIMIVNEWMFLVRQKKKIFVTN